MHRRMMVATLVGVLAIGGACGGSKGSGATGGAGGPSGGAADANGTGDAGPGDAGTGDTGDAEPGDAGTGGTNAAGTNATAGTQTSGGGLTGSGAVLTPQPLPGNCSLTFKNAWLTTGAKAFLGTCDAGFSSVPVDGSAATLIVPFGNTLPITLEFDQKNLVYVDSKLHLMSVPVTGGTPTTLSLDVAGVVGAVLPRLAADGAHVVFATNSAMGPDRLLQSVPVGGGTPVTLHTHGSPISYFSLSPDGSRVFTLSDGYTLLSIPVGGGPAVDLGIINLGGMSFSADGKKMAFVTTKPGTDTGPYVLGIGALDATPTATGGVLDTGGGGANRSVFLPDNSRVVVDWTGSQQLSMKRHIDSVPVEGGTAATLVAADKATFWGVVGKAGNSVLYSSQLGALTPELSIIDAAGGTPVKLSSLDKCTFSIARPYVAVSPDGTRAVYTDANANLVLADLDARTAKALVAGAMGTVQPCTGYLPTWSPDGTKIVYQHCPLMATHCEARVVSTAGAPLATVGESPSGLTQFYFSPDSTRLIGTAAVFTFGASGATSRPYRANIPLSAPNAHDCSPATFPWLDNRRFVVEAGSSGNFTTGLIDVGG